MPVFCRQIETFDFSQLSSRQPEGPSLIEQVDFFLRFFRQFISAKRKARHERSS